MVKDTVLIIPALNEEDSLPLVLNDLPRERLLEIIVVDNGSVDATADRARAAGALVLSEPQRGYGKACLTGINYALKNFNFLNLAFIDGDYSDHPQELEDLLEQIDRGHDFVLGSRMLGKAEPGALLPQAIFGNWLATSLTRLFFGGFRFSDLGPFRVIKRKAYEQLEMQDENFGWTMEMQVKAICAGLKISEISVSYRQRVGVSKITGTLSGTFKAGYKILYTIFKYRILTFFKSRQ